MEDINLNELFKFMLSKFVIILVSAAIFLTGGFIYTNYLITPMYHSSTTLILVSDSSGDNSTINQNDLTLNKNLVTTYSEIVKSRLVLNNVIKKLDLNVSAEELSRRINVTSVENTEIIKIEVSDENNEVAREIANTTADVFKEEVQKIYNLKNVSTVDKAFIQNKPYNINLTKHVVVAAGIGFIIGVAIVFLIFYFDTSINSVEDIEEKIGLSVLGKVNLIENNNQKNKRG